MRFITLQGQPCPLAATPERALTSRPGDQRRFVGTELRRRKRAVASPA